MEEGYDLLLCADRRRAAIFSALRTFCAILAVSVPKWQPQGMTVRTFQAGSPASYCGRGHCATDVSRFRWHRARASRSLDDGGRFRVGDRMRFCFCRKRWLLRIFFTAR
ncbi:hypothetical protein CAAN1_26S00232 [[Candida] anglica]|uniref:Uncharacterized protein n=1 Tax=[Candida] anglica TaxID=148631 RepID=A0ABP0EHG6_9ASCO